ncbi:hypothetical protein [Paenibacillus terrigena]|uniref:hypothetical protein n=1 Tax=Paenibacillus terrigena TaxID=369333 RepID=UPI00035F6187|nr:hypothetical protein [Paenibacillus terrigena]
MVRLLMKLSKLLGLVILVSSLTLITTGLIVNSYIDSVLKKFNIQLEGKPFALSSLWGGSKPSSTGAGSTPAKADDAAGASSAKPQDGAVPAFGGVTEPPAEPGDGHDDATAGGRDAPAGGEAPGATGATGSSSSGTATADPALPPAATPKEDVIIPSDAIAKAKDGLSKEEKEKVFTTLISKIPANELQTVLNAVEDGLTGSELTEVEQIIAKYVSTEEYDKLIELLKQ